MIRTFASLAIVAVLATSAHAGDKAASAQTPEGPRMTEPGRKFVDAWLGRWSASDVALTMGGQTMRGSIEMSCESVASGWGALCTRKAAIAGLPPWTAVFLVGWNIGTGEGHLFEVSEAADVNDLAGAWAADGTITLTRDGKSLEGQQERIACRLAWPSAATSTVACTSTQSGATAWTFSYTTTRQK
jgi:hypothetical protein